MSRSACPYRAVHEFDTDGLCRHCFKPAFPKSAVPEDWESLPSARPWWMGWTGVALLLPAPGGWREVPALGAGGNITGYARAIIGPQGWEYRAEINLLLNRVEIHFPPPRAVWGRVEAVSLHKADGSRVTTIELSTAKAIQPGDTPRFSPGALTWEVA